MFNCVNTSEKKHAHLFIFIVYRFCLFVQKIRTFNDMYRLFDLPLGMWDTLSISLAGIFFLMSKCRLANKPNFEFK